LIEKKEKINLNDNKIQGITVMGYLYEEGGAGVAGVDICKNSSQSSSLG
jgi:hypothetical protein